MNRAVDAHMRCAYAKMSAAAAVSHVLDSSSTFARKHKCRFAKEASNTFAIDFHPVDQNLRYSRIDEVHTVALLASLEKNLLLYNTSISQSCVK